MSGLLLGATSFVVSEERAFHSSNAPSTRGVEGTDPRYPSIQAPGFSRSETTPAPRPNGWTAGRRTPNVSPLAEAKSPRTVRLVELPSASCIGANENVTSLDVGAT